MRYKNVLPLGYGEVITTYEEQRYKPTPGQDQAGKKLVSFEECGPTKTRVSVFHWPIQLSGSKHWFMRPDAKEIHQMSIDPSTELVTERCNVSTNSGFLRPVFFQFKSDLVAGRSLDFQTR